MMPQNNEDVRMLCEKCQGMTQQKGQIGSNLKKIRQKTLRKFLLFVWKEIEARIRICSILT